MIHDTGHEHIIYECKGCGAILEDRDIETHLTRCKTLVRLCKFCNSEDLELIKE